MPTCRVLCLLVLSAATVPLAGCSSRQLYGAGQEWQRNECRHLPTQEQDRCLAGTRLSHDDYQRQRAAVANP